MGRDDEDVRAVLRHAIDLGHGPHGIFEVLDDVGKIHAGKRVFRQGPGIGIEIPDVIRGRAGCAVDADGVRFRLARSAADIQDHSYIMYSRLLPANT